MKKDFEEMELEDNQNKKNSKKEIEKEEFPHI